MATLATNALEGVVDPLDMSRAELYRDDTWPAPFKRLRDDCPGPVRYSAASAAGARCHLGGSSSPRRRSASSYI